MLEEDNGSLSGFRPGEVFIMLIRIKKCYTVNSRFVILQIPFIELDNMCKVYSRLCPLCISTDLHRSGQRGRNFSSRLLDRDDSHGVLQVFCPQP